MIEIVSVDVVNEGFLEDENETINIQQDKDNEEQEVSYEINDKTAIIHSNQSQSIDNTIGYKYLNANNATSRQKERKK